MMCVRSAPQSQYEPLPEARGPLNGVARWAQQVSMQAQHVTQQAQQVTQQACRHGGAVIKSATLRSRLSGGEKGGGEKGGGGDGGSVVSESGEAAYSAHGSSRGGGAAAPRKTVLFLGDSLITGVGCSQESSHGPALPRAVAEFLSRRLRVDVQWAAFGETGGDVRTMRSKLLPTLADEVAALRANGQNVDIVVVVCGLNDFKKAYRSSGNTAGGFCLELGELVREVKLLAGSDCTVVLPALPVHRAPVFDGIWPLQHFLAPLAALWDEQKLITAQRVRRVCFVRNAERDEWWSAKQYWAVDGIHPNDEGYRIWGEHIADGILSHLRAAQKPALLMKPAEPLA
uniref:SGNH hydrolase-type esterase domain-containing protein n=1 Tax=Chrysotila carterae TaxID=13221 RepID=A0A7S4F7Z2_CHRCT